MSTTITYSKVDDDYIKKTITVTNGSTSTTESTILKVTEIASLTEANVSLQASIDLANNTIDANSAYITEINNL